MSCIATAWTMGQVPQGLFRFYIGYPKVSIIPILCWTNCYPNGLILPS